MYEFQMKCRCWVATMAGRERFLISLVQFFFSPPPYFPLENQKNCVPLSHSESAISGTCVELKREKFFLSKLFHQQESQVERFRLKKCGAIEPHVPCLVILDIQDGKKNENLFYKVLLHVRSCTNMVLFFSRVVMVIFGF